MGVFNLLTGKFKLNSSEKAMKEDAKVFDEFKNQVKDKIDYFLSSKNNQEVKDLFKFSNFNHNDSSTLNFKYIKSESYIDIDIIINYFKNEFKDNQRANLIKNLDRDHKRVFLSIFEFFDLKVDYQVDAHAIFLENIQQHLNNLIDKDKVKTILENLSEQGIIEMHSSSSYQILPHFLTNDGEDYLWEDFIPLNFSSNLNKENQQLRNQIFQNSFKNKYGYFENQKNNYYDFIKNELKNIFGSDLEFYHNSEVTFTIKNTFKTKDGIFEIENINLRDFFIKYPDREKIGLKKQYRISKKDRKPITGIVFSLIEDNLKNNENGSLSSIQLYKNGIDLFYKSF